jgi:DNA topoisomerase II
LFPPVDLEVLPTRLEEGYEIEPSCLAPVLPILLMNGTRGLATGYTSFIPAYHPTVLLQLTRLRLSCSSLEACRNLYAQQHPEAGDQGPWIPWYQGFRGSITSVTSKSFTSRGVWTQVADHQYRVTELPLFTWTDAYRKLLLKLKDRGVIVDFREDPQEHVVVVDVFTNPTSTPEENWWSLMQLESVHTIQPTVFVVDPESFRTSLRTATSTWDLFESWYQYRFSVYQRRRVYVLQHMQAAIPGLIRTERFIQLVLSGVIALGQSHEQVMQTGQEHGFTPEELEGLMDLKFSKFTKEKVVQLQHQIQQAQTEADLYANKTIPMLWEEDLAPLEKAFQTHWQSWG